MFMRIANLKIGLFTFILAALLFIPAGAAQAHGVEIEYAERSAIEITARYDTGGPLAGAQVAVFAPGSPAEPWLTGVCDDFGKFYFVPDPQIAGLWEVQVRLAGHGGLVRIEAGESGAVEQAAAAGYSAAQKALMAAAVIWGLVGTAFFFSRRHA